MLRLTLTVVISCILILPCLATIWKDCGSAGSTVKIVQVAGCDSGPFCILKSGTNATLSVNFTAKGDSNTAKAVVHGIIGGIPVPFPLPDPNACQGKGIECPLKDGILYNYVTQIPVESSYPKIKVVVKWELKDETGKDILCVVIPAAIR